MAEMKLGYGSEYQLLRFLGHHRIELDKEIKKVLKTEEAIYWFDYPKSDKRLSKDSEWEEIDCFKNEANFSEIESAWKKFWPQSGKSINWDGIFKCGDTYYFVEAKARKDEMSPCDATKEESRKKIKTAFKKTIEWLKCESNENSWIESKDYQLANRLAFIYFCECNGIKARLVYINFINGYRDPVKDLSIANKEEWQKIWKKKYADLKLTEDKLKNKLYHVYINCAQK